MDALVYCDMTTTPDGEPTDVDRAAQRDRETLRARHLVDRFHQRGPSPRSGLRLSACWSGSAPPRQPM